MSALIRRLLGVAQANNHDVNEIIKCIGTENTKDLMTRIMKPKTSTVMVRSAAYVNNTAYQFKVPSQGPQRLAILTESVRSALAAGHPDAGKNQIRLIEPTSNQIINSDADLDVVIGNNRALWLKYKVVTSPGGDPNTKLRDLVSEATAERERAEASAAAAKARSMPATVDSIKGAVIKDLQESAVKNSMLPADGRIRAAMTSQVDALESAGVRNPVQVAAQISADLCHHIRARAAAIGPSITPTKIQDAVATFVGESSTWNALNKHIANAKLPPTTPDPAELQKAWHRDTFNKVVYPAVPAELRHPTVTPTTFTKHYANLPRLDSKTTAVDSKTKASDMQRRRADPLAKLAAASAQLASETQRVAATIGDDLAQQEKSAAVRKQQELQTTALSSSSRSVFNSFMKATSAAASAANIGNHRDEDSSSASDYDSDDDDVFPAPTHKEFDNLDRIAAAKAGGMATVKLVNRMTRNSANINVTVTIGQQSQTIVYGEAAKFSVPAGTHSVKIATSSGEQIGSVRSFKFKAGSKYSATLVNWLPGNILPSNPLTALETLFTSDDMSAATGSVRQQVADGLSVTLIDKATQVRTPLSSSRTSIAPGVKLLEISTAGRKPTVSKLHELNVKTNKGYVVYAGVDSGKKVWLDYISDSPLTPADSANALSAQARPAAATTAATSAASMQSALGDGW